MAAMMNQTSDDWIHGWYLS